MYSRVSPSTLISKRPLSGVVADPQPGLPSEPDPGLFGASVVGSSLVDVSGAIDVESSDVGSGEGCDVESSDESSDVESSDSAVVVGSGEVIDVDSSPVESTSVESPGSAEGIGVGVVGLWGPTVLVGIGLGATVPGVVPGPGATVPVVGELVAGESTGPGPDWGVSFALHPRATAEPARTKVRNDNPTQLGLVKTEPVRRMEIERGDVCSVIPPV